MSNDITQHEIPDSFENPGLPPHKHRLSDESEKASKRAERQTAGLFTFSILASLVGIVGFFLVPAGETLLGVRLGTTILGLGLGIGMLGIGLGAVHWAKSLMNDEEQVEDRHAIPSDAETREVAVGMLERGAKDANVARRPVLKGTLLGAILLAPLTFLVPLVVNLSDNWSFRQFQHTAWANKPEGAKGRRLATDPAGRPIRAADVTNNSVFHVIPHDLGKLPGEEDFLNEKAKAIVLLVRIEPELLKVSEGKEDWNYHGIIAFSKVCTHVGCPVALYEQTTKHLLCPCHQSTFDLTDEAKVVFGPAKRPLPQLPISVDDEGYLIATSDFDEPIGPSFWERDK